MVNILVGCTGSVASVKLPALIEKLKNEINHCAIQIVPTTNAKRFFSIDDPSIQVLQDEDEWGTWNQMGDPILHIELRNWADLFLIAPLDANTLGKLAHGLCDNLLTCVARAWDLKNKQVLFCPAMNVLMWQHPCTEKNIKILKEWGYIEVPPVSKRLACGEEGMGAMADISVIAKTVASLLEMKQ